MPLPVDSRSFSPGVTASHTATVGRSDISPEMRVWEKIESFFCSAHQPDAQECVRKICHPPAGTTREDVISIFEQLRTLAFHGSGENIQSGRHGDNHFCILDANSREILSVLLDDAGNYNVECREYRALHVLTLAPELDIHAKAEPEALCKADFKAVWLAWVRAVPQSESPDRQEAAQRVLDCLDKRYNKLDLSNLNLGDLPDRLPPGITELNLNRTSLTSLPPLPPGLEILSIKRNRLTSLPELPKSLRELRTSRNKLTSLPALPPALSVLQASFNKLTSLPELPPALSVLQVNFNRLTNLPELPKGLCALRVSQNKLTDLPALPPALSVLAASFNKLTRLPELPPGITDLILASNKLTHLPELPPGLQVLQVEDNSLNRLPALPPGITDLILASNELTHLPELPPGLREADIGLNQLTRPPESIERLSSDAVVDVTDNPLSAHALQALRDMTGAPGYSGPRILFSMDRSHVTGEVRALHMAVANWLPPAGEDQPPPAERWQAFEEEPDSAAFRDFLDSLSETENFKKDPIFKAQIASLLAHLAGDSGLRAKTFAMARDATSSCEDRVTLALNQIKSVQLVNNAERGTYDNSIPELIAVGREMFRLEKLEQIARDKAKTLKFVDEIEVWLGYQNKLRKALKLTSVTAEMRFFGESFITKLDLENAEAQVKTAEDAGFSEWVLQWEPLRSVLKRTQPECMEALTAKKTSDYNTFYTRLYHDELQPAGLAGDTDAERDIGKRALMEAEKAYLDGLRPAVAALAGGELKARWGVTLPGSSSLK